jgi:hypothetical protein
MLALKLLTLVFGIVTKKMFTEKYFFTSNMAL